VGFGAAAVAVSLAESSAAVVVWLTGFASSLSAINGNPAIRMSDSRVV
jgi:hypothetical protein